MSMRDPTARRQEAMGNAISMGVWCPLCLEQMIPDEPMGFVMVPQYLSTRPYAIVRFKCTTSDCGHHVDLEIDL